jgi:uncharacterized CHY-type Zn-finger protein
MSEYNEMLKCANCQSLFMPKAIRKYASRLGLNANTDPLKCPVCRTRFSDGGLEQLFHGQRNPPSLRNCTVPEIITASPDDR